MCYDTFTYLSVFLVTLLFVKNYYQHMSTDNIKRDFCDGEFFRSHPIFSVHHNALQFLLYHDDVEVANPLGSRAGNRNYLY